MEKKLLRVYDRNMNLKGILDKAHKIGYDLEQNNIWKCWFTMPLNDSKNADIIPNHFLELWDHEKRIGMFVVKPIDTVKNKKTRTVSYQCEHVLGTFHSEVLFGYHQFTNLETETVLQALIDEQEEVFWQLGTVDFTRFFHYAWENEESLLNAIFSIPKPFNESYIWTWDDTTVPFTLNLIQATSEVVDTIRAGKNLLGIKKKVDPFGIVNRIYPLGYGEGVNQLTIKDVNGGIPYLEDSASIAQYGLQKHIWIDRRFEDPDSLKANGQGLLDLYKDPIVTYLVDTVYYELIDPYQIVKYGIGKILEVKDEDTNTDIQLRIMRIHRPDIYGDPLNVKFDLGNVQERLETTISDLEKKQLVNETYSQGSTNIDSHDYTDNCDQNNPAVIRFFLPDDLVNVNTMILSYETEEFRAYAQATEGGGAIVETTSSGGAVVNSTSSGGGTTETSTSGGGGTHTSSSGGATVESTDSQGTHRHRMFSYFNDTGSTDAPGNFFNYLAVSDSGGGSVTGIFAPGGSTNDLYTEEASGAHSHSVSIPNHTHDVTIPNHSHDVTVPNHTHQVNIPNHTHDITLPDHTHDINHGIYKLSTLPTAVEIRVDGNLVPETALSGNNIDLIPYLDVDAGGRILRGTWHEVTITPDALGRINANIITRLFIQSRLGGTH